MDEIEQRQRAAVVEEALSWRGTPYRHNGSIKGIAADCIGMMKGAYQNVHIIPKFDLDTYSPQWHLHRDEELLLDGVMRFATESAAVVPGNLILFREGRCFAHCGIIVAHDEIVHAKAQYGKVLRTPLDQSDLCFRNGKPRERKIFDPWVRPAS